VKRLVLIAAAILVVAAIWCGLVFVGFSEGWGRKPIAASPEPEAFISAARAQIADAGVGNLAMVLVEDGAVAGDYYVSDQARVGPQTLFQVASLSKWLTAWGVMALVEDGRIDLDAPVSTYLTRWRLPDGPFDQDGVTVRRLLSHTAGLGDGLGYAGFASADEVQSLEESLTQARDASPGADGAVRVVTEPGSGWDYSGGGYTLLQLIVEEVSGQSFPDYMQAEVFQPLGMGDTTFDFDEASKRDLAQSFTLDGETEPLRRYTALGAASLFTSAGDMARFLAAQAPGSPEPDAVLTAETRAAMRAPHAAQFGADIWGLGTMLYAPNGRGDFVIGHDGNNEPAINTAVRLDPATGDGIVVLETGGDLTATRIASEWVYWKTGKIDALLFVMRAEAMIIWMLAGSGLILLAGVITGWRLRRRR
jgi:CubicO group peptidase (beta-lactamase class C family)